MILHPCSAELPAPAPGRYGGGQVTLGNVAQVGLHDVDLIESDDEKEDLYLQVQCMT